MPGAHYRLLALALAIAAGAAAAPPDLVRVEWAPPAEQRYKWVEVKSPPPAVSVTFGPAGRVDAKLDDAALAAVADIRDARWDDAIRAIRVRVAPRVAELKIAAPPATPLKDDSLT